MLVDPISHLVKLLKKYPDEELPELGLPSVEELRDDTNNFSPYARSSRPRVALWDAKEFYEFTSQLERSLAEIQDARPGEVAWFAGRVRGHAGSYSIDNHTSRPTGEVVVHIPFPHSEITPGQVITVYGVHADPFDARAFRTHEGRYAHYAWDGGSIKTRNPCENT